MQPPPDAGPTAATTSSVASVDGPADGPADELPTPPTVTVDAEEAQLEALVAEAEAAVAAKPLTKP